MKLNKLHDLLMASKTVSLVRHDVSAMVQKVDREYTECENVRSYFTTLKLLQRKSMGKMVSQQNSSCMFTLWAGSSSLSWHQPCVCSTRSETAREAGDHYRSYSWTGVQSEIRDRVRLRWLLKWAQCVHPPTSCCLLHTVIGCTPCMGEDTHQVVKHIPSYTLKSV